MSDARNMKRSKAHFVFRRNNVLALLTDDDEDEVDMRRLEKKMSLDIIYNI